MCRGCLCPARVGQAVMPLTFWLDLWPLGHRQCGSCGTAFPGDGGKRPGFASEQDEGSHPTDQTHHRCPTGAEGFCSSPLLVTRSIPCRMDDPLSHGPRRCPQSHGITLLPHRGRPLCLPLRIAAVCSFQYCQHSASTGKGSVTPSEAPQGDVQGHTGLHSNVLAADTQRGQGLI